MSFKESSFMEIMINILSSKRLTMFILLAWFLTIFFAWWFVHPKVDDGIYLIPAIGTFQINVPSINFSDSIEPVFFIFPTQPFLHGIFLKILNFLFIDISVDTYRVFNYLSTLVLFYLIYKLFSIVFPNSAYKTFSFNLFLILLGFSQFSLQFYVNRPEIPGLLFFTLGLIYFFKFIKSIKKRKLYVLIFSFCFGVSSTFHPNFMLLSSLMLAYCFYFIINNKDAYYLKYLTLFFIPVSILVVWFLINIDIVQGQLFNRIQEVSSVSMPGISNIFSTLAGDESLTFAHNTYLKIYMLTLLLALILSIFYVFRSVNYKNKDFIHMAFSMLVISSFILLMIMQPYRPYYLLVSFLSIISISFFITNHLSLSSYGKAVYQEKSSKSYSRIIKSIPFILLPLTFPLSHIAKNFLTNEVYDNPHNTIEALGPFLSADKHIFITTAQLLPLFTSQIASDFETNNRNIHWYFPVADTPGSRFKELMRQDINIETHLMQDAIWGALIITTSFNKQNTIACLSLKGGDFFINLHNPKILFKDTHNIFLTSSEVIPSNKCFE